MPPATAPSTPPRPSAFAQLGWAGVLSILWRYFKSKSIEQARTIWFIIVYLIAFQVLVLDLPVIYGATIGVGILVVIVGLTFFMEGLRLGLMPFGETIGAILPRNTKLPVILGFAFILGVGATFAEPAISVLRAAGAGVPPDQAPLLFSLLNDFPGQLVTMVGLGVGVAVALGISRFFLGWSLKWMILPIVLLLLILTLHAYFDPVLNPVIGLAWDCGAVTTGPVTVPLVLALGIGVCRIVDDNERGGSGFGIVTLASLFPILAVLLLALFHYVSADFFGAANYRGDAAAVVGAEDAKMDQGVMMRETDTRLRFSQEEFDAYVESGELSGEPDEFRTIYRGGDVVLEDGRIVHRGSEIVLEKRNTQGRLETLIAEQTERPWNPQVRIVEELFLAGTTAVRAIVPLCAFLVLTLLVVLRERLRRADEIAVGVVFAVVGMGLFGLGLSLGLIPLGTQLGSNIPLTFTMATPWGFSGSTAPLFDDPWLGKGVAILFAFFLGYGATLAEPALNALGVTVENTTVGVFKKSLLMHTVAIGVGLGIAAGVAQLTFPSLKLTMLLIPPYLLLMVLTVISSEEFVNFAWDSAGVTTGPITVPLVLAMGLGIGANIPGVSDGFGILALASVGPIITVLTVGLMVNRSARRSQLGYSQMDEGV